MHRKPRFGVVFLWVHVMRVLSASVLKTMTALAALQTFAY